MLKKCIAYFVIEALDEQGTYTEAGFYPADSFSEAMTYLEEFYGADLALVKHLELLEGSMICMRPEVAAEIVADFV